ncbi:LacI family DNA-binding transcriptional regulator [Microbacterium esteraromaticum]|uniref:LacI family DNA-binding transcriptional regulator n=1 Tax=Microbacterium esteraromaticum TaxID=57043 RepID=A0A939DTN6_9MICO|nr:LacI family DNA-binding transcriptional regulator [Microbacterium esteraromaticum]MBN8204985.1 LacI family DNA-binding transcriptional regulator [Microbacterium esteraromaticum]MBN8415139.1 LacI family DNA-binding transcriptional regulator [Microbacterium esteraromaticum]MBN8424583.1 LacI family DNA-binding transcriptional regulator [Microbacterium esteraromaticum]MCA1306982.1 LacI family transcriptional regulator [Microbacterium esteraromaticum]WDH79127.1 LacI family DNA-binding transcript
MTSIDEVAKLAGVSTATVSRALSGRGHVSPASRERVRIAAETLGYVVSSRASSLASGRTQNVGVIVPFLDRWFFSTVLSGASSALMRAGYDITLYNITADADVRKDVFSTFLRRKRVDAVIAVSIELDDDETGRLQALGLPVIAIGGPNPQLRTLTVDDTAVARLATEHLIGLGHRAIAHIGANPEFDIDFHIPTRRRLGFEQALADAGITPNPDFLEPADFTVDGGFRAAKQLLGRPGPRPTAIFAASDEMAIGAILAARDLGFRVPEDLSIVGIDGHELGEFFQLTTVDQFPLGQGERAAGAVLAQLEGDTEAAVGGELPFELIVRGTTARV